MGIQNNNKNQKCWLILQYYYMFILPYKCPRSCLSFCFSLYDWRLEQCSDAWAISRSEPTLFWKHNFEVINNEIMKFTSLMTRSLRKIISGVNLDFFWVSFSIAPLILSFLLTWRVTLFYLSMLGQKSENI